MARSNASIAPGYIVSFASQPSTYASRAADDVVDRRSPYRSINMMSSVTAVTILLLRPALLVVTDGSWSGRGEHRGWRSQGCRQGAVMDWVGNAMEAACQSARRPAPRCTPAKALRSWAREVRS